MDDDSHWSLVYDAYVPEQQRLREALCTLGNGYFATRGAFPEVEASEEHYPGTYLAGGYNRLTTERSGRIIESEDLVNLPNWLSLTFRVDGGEWFHPRAVQFLSFRQELNIRHGVLERKARFRDAHGRTSQLHERRLVHLQHFHLASIERTLVAEDWSGTLEVQSALDGRVVNSGVERYRDLNHKHLLPREQSVIDDHLKLLKVETSQSELRLAQSSRVRIVCNGEVPSLTSRAIEKPGYVAQQFSLQVSEGDTVIVEKTCALYSSRDNAITECAHEATRAATEAPSFAELLGTQRSVWESLWRVFDIGIELAEVLKPPHPLLILRLHIFHLLQTVSMNSIDLDVGVPARGWHGEAYRGHIFWDELFIFPLLNLRSPQITRSLLTYRFRRLPRARLAASQAGFRGALFPWQSGSNGREESQRIHLNPRSGRWVPDHSHLQRHVNGAIAYNVWQYYQVSQDLDFLIAEGAEMIVEIARLLASQTTFNANLNRYEILGVMGPDEYHDAYPGASEPGVNNNAYTNLLTVWVLTRAIEVLELLPQSARRELCERLRLNPEELELWREIGTKMRLVFHGDSILSQFEGFEKLAEFDWEGYRAKYGDIHRLDRILEGEGKSTNAYQVAKQADVLMLFYLFSAEELVALIESLGYSFQSEMIPKNIDYYVSRTSHGSTLSSLVHSWVEARRDRRMSWELFVQALHSDIADVRGGTTAEGIHLGAMAGTVDLVQRGYAGLKAEGDCLQIDPKLPQVLRRIHLHVYYRRHALTLDLSRDRLSVSSLHTSAPPICLAIRERCYELKGGETLEVHLQL